MVSKETLERSQQWHRQVFSHLITALRRQISADSHLLRDLDDYALIMQTEDERMLPPERIFDCGALLDRALAQARQIQPPHRRVHLSVSLQPGMPRLYHGQPDLLEALLRHLLLIAFSRTKAGLVLLRLAPENEPGSNCNIRLRIRLEDSGPPLQPWQLHRWLKHAWERESLAADEHAISWMLASRLFHHLKGSVTANSAAEGGLQLEGLIPLSIAWRPSDFLTTATTEVNHHLTAPLILIVEPEAGSRRELTEILATAGYRVFVVHEHGQAIEWAVCLPVSIVLLNMVAPGSWQEAAHRLRRQMRQHIMPEAGLWALTTQLMPEKGDEIEQVLLKPLRPELLKHLRADVRPLDTGFYHAFDQAIRDDLPDSVIARMPYLHQQLGLELSSMKEMAGTLSHDRPIPDAAHQAHAIKSIALSLGYFRLAALMTEVEHAIHVYSFAHAPQNWSVIAECLAQAALVQSSTFQNPSARLAVTS
jgi:CheY-like chemotaxis protein